MSSIESEDLTSTSLSIDTTPLAMSVPVGSAIFGLTGEAWITQEGVYDDIILRAGERFDVRSKGPIVISATQDRAVVYIARPADSAEIEGADLASHFLRRATAWREQSRERAASVWQAAREQLSHLLGALAPKRSRFGH